MDDIYRIKEAISGSFRAIANDKYFDSDNLIEDLYSKFSKKPIQYSPEKSLTHQSEEILNAHNAPTNFQYSPGQKYQYFDFWFAVSGVAYSIQELADRPALKYSDFNFNSKNVIKYFSYKIFVPQNILGNDIELEKLNVQAKEKRAILENAINEYNESLKLLNIEIKNHLQQEFLNEKKRREIKKTSMDKLKPF